MMGIQRDIANWYMIWVYQNTEKTLQIDLFIS